jgi:hypothetical protein
MASSAKDNKFFIGSKDKSEIFNERNSLNPFHTLNEESCDQSDKEYRYQRRIGRQFSINCHPTKDNKFYKVIIPYNFDLRKYWISKKEIEFYENKMYLEKKLVEFNDNPAFNIDKLFEPKLKLKICLYVPTIFLSLIVIYLALILIAFFSFNPIILYTVSTWIKKGFNSLKMFKFLLFEKFKIKEIHNILKEENNSKFCAENKLKWILGKSGYWLEVQKLME